MLERFCDGRRAYINRRGRVCPAAGRVNSHSAQSRCGERAFTGPSVPRKCDCHPSPEHGRRRIPSRSHPDTRIGCAAPRFGRG